MEEGEGRRKKGRCYLMIKLQIVIGTIIVFFGLDAFLKKYGHRRITMESVWVYSKIAILWIEHVALLLVGFVGGWLLFRFKKGKKPDSKYISREEIKSIVRAENITNRYVDKNMLDPEPVKEEQVVKSEVVCPEWGKEFVKAIGQVWLEKNFGKNTITKRA